MPRLRAPGKAMLPRAVTKEAQTNGACRSQGSVSSLFATLSGLVSGPHRGIQPFLRCQGKSLL